nr:venom protein [Lampona murina]
MMEIIDPNRNLSRWNKRIKLEKTLCFLAITSLFIFSEIIPAFGTVYHCGKCGGAETDSQQTISDLSTSSPDDGHKDIIKTNTDSQLTISDLSTSSPDDDHMDTIQTNAEYCQPCPFKSPTENYCMTPECLTEAARILYSLDETVDPCTDFFQFACGGWIEQHSIPENKAYVVTLEEELEDFHLKLKELLDRKLSGSEPLFIKMIKNFYDTCMDLVTIETEGSKPLKDVLKKLGGWPVLEGTMWDESKFDWIQLLISLRKLGFDHKIFLYLSVSADEKNKEVNKIQLFLRKAPLFGLKNDIQLKHQALMEDSIKLLAAYDEYENGVKEEFSDLLKFEGALLNIFNEEKKGTDVESSTTESEFQESTPQEKEEEGTDVKSSSPESEFQESITETCSLEADEDEMEEVKETYTVKDLEKQIPTIPWREYLNDILNDEINEDETLVIPNLEHIKKFVELMSKANKRVVANYMLWNVVIESMPLLSREWRILHRRYQSLTEKKIEEKSRWEQCLVELTGSLNLALGSYYVRHYMDEESEGLISEIETYLRRELVNILNEAYWMDAGTKGYSKKKAKSMSINVGYPEELRYNAALMEIYKDLMMNNESYYKNKIQIQKWKTDNALFLLRKLNTKRDWRSRGILQHPGGFYNFLENSIDIAMGTVKGVFFKKKRPRYLNFGALGYATAHEMTHGFDRQNRKHDKGGNKINWQNATTDGIFKRKRQCIINQYDSYSIENGMKVDGCNTLDENFADNGGLLVAYRAYQSWVKDNGPDELLPGLKYNQNQMFWISAAHIWCGKTNPNNLEQSLMEPHSPFQFRVIGPMSNREEFSQDFNCSPGSPMNRENKCQVW